ncbi:MAG: DUF1549 domain-containing protein [Fimbriimonadaceae bacterium]|nr:DUF1549 domain-containing protein [Fimbriimonadaceae bacterium]
MCSRLGSLTALAAGTGALAVAVVLPSAQTKKPDKVEFNRDVRQILGKCVDCHGPSSGEGAGGLRLDTFAGATKQLPDGKRGVVPGKPDESELIKRIMATDENVVMPPPSSHKKLGKEEKQTLRDWIEQGAEYKEHWAFVKPVRPPLPTVKESSWPKNAIDRFVLANLEAHGLSPEGEADRPTLVRRVSLDLTGLPPTPAEVDAFVNDKSPDAYEKVVDRLLASPRYGERMAMDWMDYARYADSNGYQADFQRFQSRWRDWVIDAFNKNMPYDQFTVEQLAGDLLPNATMEQRLATGFNRNHRINTEGGVIAEEWRVETVIDRVETTSATWLGLTAGCARCHDHKYDPISQKDFYRLFAYFNNVPESGTGEERPVNHPPTMPAPTKAQSARLAHLGKVVDQLDAWLDAEAAKKESVAAAWRPANLLGEVKDGLVARYRLVPGTGKAEGEVSYGPGRATGAVTTGAKGFVNLGQVGDFERDQPFSFALWVDPRSGEGAPLARMDSNNGFRGWECSVVGGRPQAHIINKWPENALKVSAKETIPKNAWSHLVVTYDGSSKAAGMKMYINGRPVALNVDMDTLSATTRTTVDTRVGRRTDSEQFDGAVDDVAVFNRALTPAEAATLASTSPALPVVSVDPSKRTPAQKREMARFYCLATDPGFAARDKQRAAAVRERDEINAAVPNVMVMAEMPKPRDCFVLERGQYDHHGEKVTAGLPSFLPPMPKGVPNNRLGLAYWIVSPDNPLTARVTVNRMWERLFGNGIVGTIEDFGTRADYPTDPELLDWLATELVRLKWDLKAMWRELVTSAAYRQSSVVSPLKREKDPDNKLVSRGPRFRLKGEVIRDQALYVSGLLVEKIGGESVRPYMPDGVWDETNVYGNLRNYKHDTGDGLYRRSLYTIWKRTAAPPNMLLFDVPSRETCRVHRARTDTPLQALTLMNDVTYVEASRVLAERMLREGGPTAASRIAYGFQLVLSRKPTAQEVAVLDKGLESRIAKYRAAPREADKILAEGDKLPDPSLDRPTLAAYAVTASTLLNLDETVTKE